MAEKTKLKLIDAYGIFQAIVNSEKVNTRGIPFKLSWELSDVKEALQKHVTRYEEERNKVFKDLGKEKADQPGTYEIEQKDLNAVDERIKELNEMEVEIEIEPVPLGRFENANFQFAPGAFDALRKQIIKFPDEKKKETE